MKIYVSHSSDYDYINKIYKPIRNSNFFKNDIVFLPHENENMHLNAKEIIPECDLVIAEASLPSTGQGIELGIASMLNKNILCIYEKGMKTSSALRFITSNFIEYNNIEDMLNKIEEFKIDLD